MKPESLWAGLRLPRPIQIMEVCGTHTAAIARSGLRDLLPPEIRLVSGPGCPVCVTAPAFIDRLIAHSLSENGCVLTFGDMMRVPGARFTFADAKAKGGHFQVVYSPLEAVALAKANPATSYAMAAVGFETTAPLFALLLEQLETENLRNVQLLTALKTMPPVLAYLCETEAASVRIDGFLCPGHVSVVIGADTYQPLCERYRKPFVVAGFSPEDILAGIREIALQVSEDTAKTVNLYGSVVRPGGNPRAQSLVARYFVPEDGLWRGIGPIPNSALVLRPEYARFALPEDGAASPLWDDSPDTSNIQAACRCADVMLGRIAPTGCPLFGSKCTPQTPVGACMVSSEGACGIWYEATADAK